ncbi:MAG TPA: DNA polymerase III subunit gamma/tau [Pirellulales bacterium]|nr:DNA polymerase III subunit gamma/tau [Pirellulales bacterium]
MVEAPPNTPAPDGSAAADYQVVARKYRPQTFADLIGQENVAKGLQGAIQSNRIGHAYLFTGARGVGKTSAARIFAKALDCVHGPTPEPCNQCDICQSITAGSDVDVLEIDGASNNGVDEIRLLRQNISVRPSRARFKIYIIDEVHMLSKAAFNALLKTLEEPPEHVKFIFCTTEVEKIPITILSRCQRYDFAGIQTSNIVGVLRRISENEHVAVEPDALEALARRAAGSMRDSQSLLEQVLALGKQQITSADVNEMLGTAGTARLKQLVAQLVRRDPAGALRDLDAAVVEGVDIGQLIDQLLGFLRDCMVAAVGGDSPLMQFSSPGEFAEVKAIAADWGLETILAVVQILDQTAGRLRYTTQGRILVELALVRICKLDELDSLTTWISALAAGKTLEPAAPGRGPASGANSAAGRTLPGAPSAANSEPAERLASSAEAKKKADLNYDSAAPEPPADFHGADRSLPAEVPSASVDAINAQLEAGAVDPTSGPNGADPAPRTPTPLSMENAPALWDEAARTLGGLLEGHARSHCGLSVAGPDRLVVRFAKKFPLSSLERGLGQIEPLLRRLTGQRIKVELQLIEADSTPNKAPETPRPVPQRQLLVEKSQHPLVRRAVDLFKGTDLKLDGPSG